MSCFFEILQANGHITSGQLEPSDDTKYLVTVKNCSKTVTAKHIVANISLSGGPVEGIRVSPDDRYFGTLGPKESITKEITILTDRAPVGSYQLSFYLDFEGSFAKCEGEATEFAVVVG